MLLKNLFDSLVGFEIETKQQQQKNIIEYEGLSRYARSQRSNAPPSVYVVSSYLYLEKLSTKDRILSLDGPRRVFKESKEQPDELSGTQDSKFVWKTIINLTKKKIDDHKRTFDDKLISGKERPHRNGYNVWRHRWNSISGAGQPEPSLVFPLSVYLQTGKE